MKEGGNISDRPGDGTSDRPDSELSEDDAWWLERDLERARAAEDAQSEAVLEDKDFFPVPAGEEDAPGEPDDEQYDTMFAPSAAVDDEGGEAPADDEIFESAAMAGAEPGDERQDLDEHEFWWPVQEPATEAAAGATGAAAAAES